MPLSNQPLVIAGRIFRSRLILGTGKFSSPEAMRDALEASGAELVTVALRRADLSGKKMSFEYVERNREGDHICYYSDLRKMKSHYPGWGITKTIDDIFRDIHAPLAKS